MISVSCPSAQQEAAPVRKGDLESLVGEELRVMMRCQP